MNRKHAIDQAKTTLRNLIKDAEIQREAGRKALHSYNQWHIERQIERIKYLKETQS